MVAPGAEEGDVKRGRRDERIPVQISVDVRQTGWSSIPAVITNLSTTGFHLRCGERVKPNTQIWVRIGTLAPLLARVIWTDAYCLGCAFCHPLHPAVLDHIVGIARQSTTAA